MKVIDLLNKIANGEAPETIFYMGATYDYDEECMDYEDVDTGDLFFDDRYNTQILNDEVEIIEEPKEIKKIKSNGNEFYSEYVGAWIKKEETDAYCEYLMNKLNELIDVINELKKENK